MKLASVAALIALVCPMAVAQNFPDIPEPWLKPPTPRMNELVGRLQDLGLLSRYNFGQWGFYSGPIPQQVYAEECANGLRLASTMLGVLGGMPRDRNVRGWIDKLPLVEALLKELYGNLQKYAPDLVKTIALIKERCAKLGQPIDEAPYKRFSDVDKGHWADDAIHNMRELGILRGYPDNTFRG